MIINSLKRNLSKPYKNINLMINHGVIQRIYYHNCKYSRYDTKSIMHISMNSII